LRRLLLERTSRTKLLNFRLSEEEAAYLVEKADASGARSVSEYVRVTALQVAETHMRRQQPVPPNSEANLSGEGAWSLRLVFVFRALEEALREARREIVKD